MSRHKWFKLDAETWLSDPKLKEVSATVKGLWIDIICMCHLSEKYGFLTINGSNLDQKRLKKILNWSKSDSKKFQILVDLGIIRQDNDGAYYCHKLLKDKDFAEKQADFANKRYEKNPLGDPLGDPLPELERERELERDKEKEKSISTKSSKELSLQAARNSDKKKLNELETHKYFKNQRFAELWADFCRSRGVKYTVIAKKNALLKLFRYELDVCIASIENSLSNGYQGIFPEAVKAERDNPKKAQYLTAGEKAEKAADDFLREAKEKEFAVGSDDFIQEFFRDATVHKTKLLGD